RAKQVRLISHGDQFVQGHDPYTRVFDASADHAHAMPAHQRGLPAAHERGELLTELVVVDGDAARIGRHPIQGQARTRAVRAIDGQDFLFANRQQYGVLGMDMDDAADVRSQFVQPDVEVTFAGWLQIWFAIQFLSVEIDSDNVGNSCVTQPDLPGTLALDEHGVGVTQSDTDVTQCSMR